MAPPLSPWPRLRDSWWVYLLAGVAVVLFPVSLVVQVRCALGRCTGSFVERLLLLNSLSGLPRLYTCGLFIGVAVLAWLARRRTTGRQQLWWTAVAAIAAGLAVAKQVSAHSTAAGVSVVATLVVGAVLTVVPLGALAVAGRRWGVASARPVVLALGIYAVAAAGPDAVVWLLVAPQGGVGALTKAAMTFGEEIGEALAALFVLVTVRWHLPAPDIRSRVDPRPGGVPRHTDSASNAPGAAR